MTDKQHHAQFDWATELSDAQGRVTLSAQEAKEIGARLRSMGEKLKAYEDMATAAADGYRSAAAEVAKLKGQRMVLCSLLGECLPIIDAMLQLPGDDASDARLYGLISRIKAAQAAVAEEALEGCKA